MSAQGGRGARRAAPTRAIIFLGQPGEAARGPRGSARRPWAQGKCHGAWPAIARRSLSVAHRQRVFMATMFERRPSLETQCLPQSKRRPLLLAEALPGGKGLWQNLLKKGTPHRPKCCARLTKEGKNGRADGQKGAFNGK